MGKHFDKRKAELQNPGAAMQPFTLDAAALALAAECNDEQCLEKWKDSQTKEIEKYVPKQYQKRAFDSIQKHFEKRKAELQNPGAATQPFTLGAAALALAAECNDEHCLEKWKDSQTKEIENYVPKEYQ